VIDLLTPEDVAKSLGVTVKTLANWRSAGLGPASLKVGKYARYEPTAVDAYIESLRPKSNVTPLPRRRAG
jgi:predicted site-specific integrase-resolvase